ncbi:MAG: DUF411 domain-containing protein [Methylocystaceae bacterium]|jgi:hypothetical protein|nr:DUF411 domain-containing protein [Methylocystaceae bacterium]NBT97162.1 DUF411 domain-containing protein [Methylocystaceae bacterium]
MSDRRLSRRQTTKLLLTATAFLVPTSRLKAASQPDNLEKITMHKSATCGCCGKWALRMREAGFVVEEIIEADMQAVKSRLGVSEKMQSCHTSEIAGYIVEGHVPAQAIKQLLQERPKVSGIAAPGMPSGSPGMEMGAPEVYTLYLFDAAGARPLGKWQGDKPA